MVKTVITILLVLGIAAVGFVFLLPEWKNFVSVREEIKNLRSISGELDGLIENKDALIDSVNRISKNDLDRINQAMPQEKHAAELLTFFENLSGRSGLVLKNIDLADKTEARTAGALNQPKPGASIILPKSNSQISEFPITMNLLGTYDAFKTFLSGLEKSLRIIHVQNVTFGSAGVSGIFGFTVRAKAFYQ